MSKKMLFHSTNRESCLDLLIDKGKVFRVARFLYSKFVHRELRKVKFESLSTL